MIFYFTATGNSLYIAKELDHDFYSIPQELKKKNLSYKDETIGIVAPIYAGQLPLTVKRFLEKAEFETDYLYFILTYGANDSVACQWTECFCLNQGICVDYIHTIKMVDNYLPSFDMDEQKRMDKEIPLQLENIKLELSKRTHDIPKFDEDDLKLYETVQKRFEEHPELNNGENIFVTSKCEGCKMCAKVCPIGNITFENNHAKRIHNSCDFCLACVQNCPFNALRVKGEKNPEARYRNPYVSLKDIVLSNQQGE